MNQSFIDLSGMRKLRKHKKRLEKQRARKAKAQKSTLLLKQRVGSLHWVKTRTGLAPHNTGAGTVWLIEAGCVAIGEITLSGYKLWLTKGIPYTSMAEVKKHCKSYIARKNEVEVLPKNVEFQAVA